MKFAFSSNAFLRYDLLETIRIVASVGYQGIEIMADVPHAYPLHLSDADVLAIRRALDANRLAISNINAFMHHADGDTYHPSWIEKDPALRAKRVVYTLGCIDLAEKLGARNISTEPGGPLDGMSREEGMVLFREGLAAVEGRAREKGIRILIEPEPGLLLENSREFLEIFQDLDPEVFGINFDIGHFFCVSEDPAELIESMKDVIHHFHLEDIAPSREHHHLMLGNGAIDIPGVLGTIDTIGFEGFVTVELYTYESQAEEAAREAFRYLENWRKGCRPMG
ncbi:sugar phosphate isomerase/epimerase [Desulforhabdus sp. TSK]|uniref:sugar phosphate isomerase/epimerase family protein n=1 Tax=Desulforhabdus sp. TSK TaxID=2925014 RepID=UPI001FC8E55F|nr:sugar phosphate isomerase/epimerase family protein [Desulforhabdus sp. TSK]GKT06905.1 AP endonuclease [Desulforhabdus sp. TSK]